MDVLCSLFCLLSWPLRGPLWPCPCFAYFASCHGPCVAFRGRRVALLCSRCFLSWPLRGLPWPPLGLTLLTSVAATWPYFAHFASCLGPCVSFAAPAWPCFAYFEPCLGPCVAFCGPCMALLALFASCLGPCVAVAPCGSCLLCFRLWLLDPCGTFVLAPAWPSSAPVWPYFAFLCFLFLLRPSVAFAWPLLSLSWALRNLFGPAWPYLAYLASCLGPVMAFCGLLVAFLHFLSWPLRGPLRPQRGHYLLCCFPHLRHPWVDPLAHGVACVLAASSFRPA